MSAEKKYTLEEAYQEIVKIRKGMGYDEFKSKEEQSAFESDVARLLPKEEFKPAQPTPNFPKGGTTFTESAYKEFEGNCSKCGHLLNPATAGYQCTNINCPAVESSEPQEYASEMPYEGSPLQLQREVEFLRTASKNLHDQLQSFWNTHVVPLQEENQRLKNDLLDALDLKEGNGPTALSMVISEIKALREELLTTEKALQEINNQHQEDYKRLKSALEEIERLKAEVLKEKFPEN